MLLGFLSRAPGFCGCKLACSLQWPPSSLHLLGFPVTATSVAVVRRGNRCGLLYARQYCGPSGGVSTQRAEFFSFFLFCPYNDFTLPVTPFLFCCCCFLIQYITIIEHVSTPVPTVDNIRIQIYKYMLCIHNRQNDTSIQTKSWTKYFIDRYLPAQ